MPSTLNTHDLIISLKEIKTARNLTPQKIFDMLVEQEIADEKTDYRRRIEFLMRQIELKDERIDRLMTRVDGVLQSNKDLLLQIQKLLEKM